MKFLGYSYFLYISGFLSFLHATPTSNLSNFYRFQKVSEAPFIDHQVKPYDTFGSSGYRQLFSLNAKRINHFKSLMADRLTSPDIEEPMEDEEIVEPIEEEKPSLRIHFPRTFHKRLSYAPSWAAEGSNGQIIGKRGPGSLLYWVLSTAKITKPKDQKQVRSPSSFRTSAFYATMG